MAVRRGNQTPKPKTDQSGDERYLWEFHAEWETYLSYTRFRDFYLVQDNPRRLVEAFRRWRIAESKISQEEAQSIKEANGSWKIWAYGKGGKKGEGGNYPTWEERAIAYDEHIGKQLENVMQARRVRSFTRQLDRLDRLTEKWEEFFKTARVLRESGVRQIPDGVDELGNPKFKLVSLQRLNLGELRALIRAADDLRTQERRELGLPERINQNQLADSKGDKLDLLGGGLVDMFADSFRNLQQTKQQLGDIGDSLQAMGGDGDAD